MSIAQQIMSNPGRYSIQQLQHAMDVGIVPAYIAIPLIQEKTQQQQQMQMAAAAQDAPQQGQPTVVDQVLQQADQTEGIDTLPTELPAQGFAPGGIVAFDHGGEVPRYRVGGLKLPDDYEDTFMPPSADLESAEEGIASLAPYADMGESKSKAGFDEDEFAKAVERYKKLTGGLPSSAASNDAIRQYLQEEMSKSASSSKKDEGWKWLQLAGAIGAGASPYGLANVGQALQKVVPEWAEQKDKQRKAQLQNLMAQAQLDQQARAEGLADITGGMSLYGKELEEKGREAAANAAVRRAQIAADKDKTSVEDRGTSQYAEALSWSKYNKPTSELSPKEKAIIFADARKQYQENAGQALARANAALTGAGAQVTQADVAGQRAATDLADRARDNVDKSLGTDWNSTENRKLRELQKADKKNGTNTAAAYKQDLYAQELARLQGKSKSTTAQQTVKPQPAPAGTPKDAVPVVGPKGKTTYIGQDGKQYPVNTITFDEWAKQARAANPGVSDADLKAYFNKKYGR